ncbi:hypothetical protein ABZ553_03560 [Streptomyces sparsogenes]|uniref:hypothetical protein n=1 Tax=Streptomyces sparsogenes TaxID=67365 RepID=UPI0033F8F560
MRAVIASRECGATWEQIGGAAGMTHQSAHEEWAPDEAAWAASGRRGHSRGEPVDALRNAARLDEWCARGREGSDGIVTGPRGVRAVTDGLDATDRPQRDWEKDRPERPAMRAALAHYSDHEWRSAAAVPGADPCRRRRTPAQAGLRRYLGEIMSEADKQLGIPAQVTGEALRRSATTNGELDGQAAKEFFSASSRASRRTEVLHR